MSGTQRTSAARYEVPKSCAATLATPCAHRPMAIKKPGQSPEVDH